MIRRIALLLLVIIVGAMVLMILLSPYRHHDGFAYPLVKHTVIIHASPDSVFEFLGKSETARSWSVYVHHITPLNADSVPDGMPKSRRRAFCTADEQGRRWDETITIREPTKRRQLIIYNYVDFPLTANGVATEQLYEDLGNNNTALTFTLFFHDYEPGMWEVIKMHFASWIVLDVYKQNMENIKRIIETGR